MSKVFNVDKYYEMWDRDLDSDDISKAYTNKTMLFLKFMGSMSRLC